jgi:hypothetical protein
MRYNPGIFLAGLIRTMKNLSLDSHVLAEVQTTYLLNTSQNHYSLSQFPWFHISQSSPYAMRVIKPRRMTQVGQVAHTQQKQDMHEIF